MSCTVYTHGEDANKCWGLGGGLEWLESACRMEPRPFTHCAKPLQKSPNNQQQLPLLRQSSPGINKPPNSSHTRAATCRPMNWAEGRYGTGAASVHSESTASFPPDQKSLSGLWWWLTGDYQSVAQILVQALCLVAQAYGEDPSMLLLHINDNQAETRHLVTGGSCV